ncbi:DUF6412 domain-containing protein [Streptomyces sp. CdTB01]|uniref:DUF6412 domain-containing protein n=1 Tax=Streptomyces sp. CdTB01 TaxID=1725411 RepID=UPI00073ACC76|nr:DUF6412 domain-containing protein [Streptomyces sp. CdTB01]ALV35479.1 hypothetical protein AS200_28120 [Streptomyces sp. CdTB01]
MIRDRIGARPFAVLVLLLVQIALLDTGTLAATVALAATAAAGSALAACALVAARCAPAVPPTRVRTAIRDRARRTAFLPQRDPDARGRTRPRAPGRALPATAA